jgi:hypothetical protein
VLLLYADPDGGHPLLEIHVKNLLCAPPYNRREAAEGLIADLHVLGIPRLLDDDILGGTRPGIPLTQLTDGRIERLLAVIDRWIDNVHGRPR